MGSASVSVERVLQPNLSLYLTPTLLSSLLQVSTQETFVINLLCTLVISEPTPSHTLLPAYPAQKRPTPEPRHPHSQSWAVPVKNDLHPCVSFPGPP